MTNLQKHEYKNSGINWIGKIPKNWKISKVKYEYEIQTGATPDTTNQTFYDGNNIWVSIDDMNEKFISDSKVKITQEAIKSCRMDISPKGSLLFSFKLSIGKVSFCNKDLYTNEAIATFFSNSNNLEFLYYTAPIFIVKNANKNIYGADLLNQQLIQDAIIILPPLEEQKKITEYLDKKCENIDNVLEQTKKQIELLKEYKLSVITEAVTKGLDKSVELKDSGIKWIGKIPKHWKMEKIKYIADIRGRIGFKGYNVSDLVEEDSEGRAIVLGGTNIMKDGSISFDKLTYLSEFKYLESPEIMLKGGEILITKVGAGTGETAIYNFYEQRVTINPNVMLCIPKDITSSKFINYFFLSNIFKKSVFLESTQSGAQPAINQEFIKNYKIVYPSPKEQQQIADYLDKKCSQIDETIKKKELLIEKLAEYKKSLIYECVTGKKQII